MAMIVDNVLAGVKARAIFFTNQVTIDENELLGFLSSVIRLKMVNLIDSTNNEFFVRSFEEPLVASQSFYRIPYRAIGRTLRELKWIDDTTTTYGPRDMALIQIEQLNYYRYGIQGQGFYFKGDGYVIVPEVSADIGDNAALEVWYKLKPSSPVTLAASCVIESIASPNITVASVPAGYSADTPVDFIQAREGCDILAMDKVITNVAGTTFTFDPDDIPDDLAVGDYICFAQYSPVINMIPDEAQPLIEDLTARLLLYSIGDNQGAKALDDRIKEETEDLLKLIEPRIDGAPKIIINQSGLVRQGKTSWGWLGGGRIGGI